MKNGEKQHSKIMTISDVAVTGQMIQLVNIIAHEVAHAFGMKEGGGAYRFGQLIEDMYKLELWNYEAIDV